MCQVHPVIWRLLIKYTLLIGTCDEKLVRQLIQKITVFKNHFKVAFKSGVSVTVTA